MEAASHLLEKSEIQPGEIDFYCSMFFVIWSTSLAEGTENVSPSTMKINKSYGSMKSYFNNLLIYLPSKTLFFLYSEEMVNKISSTF